MSPGMHVHLRSSTGTIAVLSSESDPDFSFVPQDGTFGADRALPGYYALGDIAMRIRYPGDIFVQHSHYHLLNIRLCMAAIKIFTIMHSSQM